MIRQYVTKSYVDTDLQAVTACVIHEDDKPDTFTGLYDSRGNEIHSIPERVAFGFHGSKVKA